MEPKYIQVAPHFILNEGVGNVVAVKQYPPVNEGDTMSIEIFTTDGKFYLLNGENAYKTWAHFLYACRPF